MNCCKSAILPLAFWIWMESTFSEIDMYVEWSVLLHFLKVHTKQGQELRFQSNTHLYNSDHTEYSFPVYSSIFFNFKTSTCCFAPLIYLHLFHTSLNSTLHPPSPLECPCPCSAHNSHPRSPLCSSLRRPGLCGTRTGRLSCWSQWTPPLGTHTRTGPVDRVRE